MVLLITGCASTKHRQPSDRSFVFERDTLAFGNELLWAYETDEATGERKTTAREPKPEYHHYCFPMTRAARQFYDFAEFQPQLPRTNIVATIDLIEDVLDRNPRADPRKNEPVVIPGYAGLHELSGVHEADLKRAIGGKWQSWFQRGNWRMVFPFSRDHQLETADDLLRNIRTGQVPVVHLVRFPALTINHAVLLFGVEEREGETCFDVYDPNAPESSLELIFKQEDNTFYLGPNPYWEGGRVDVYEVFKNGLY